MMRYRVIRTAPVAFAVASALLAGTSGAAVAAPPAHVRAACATGHHRNADTSCFRRCDLACHKKYGGPSVYCRTHCEKQCGLR